MHINSQVTQIREGANSIWRTSGNQASGRSEPSIRTLTYEFCGESSRIDVPVPRMAGETVFAARIDNFCVSGNLNKNNLLLLNLPTVGNYPLNTGQWNYSNSLKETNYNPSATDIIPGIELNNTIAETDTINLFTYVDVNGVTQRNIAYSQITDVDGGGVVGTSANIDNNVFKFKDTSNNNRITYVFDPQYHPFVVIRSDDLEGRVNFNNVSDGVIGVAKPSKPATPIIGSNPLYEFTNTTKDICRVRLYDHTIGIDLMHHSTISNFYPESLRPDRFLFFSSPYLLTITLYIRSDD